MSPRLKSRTSREWTSLLASGGNLIRQDGAARVRGQTWGHPDRIQTSLIRAPAMARTRPRGSGNRQGTGWMYYSFVYVLYAYAYACLQDCCCCYSVVVAAEQNCSPSLLTTVLLAVCWSVCAAWTLSCYCDVFHPGAGVVFQAEILITCWAESSFYVKPCNI